MKVPEGVTFHVGGSVYRAGDEVPDELVKDLPGTHPLKAAPKAPTQNMGINPPIEPARTLK